MALILSIETSTTNCSVSLSNEGEIVALKEDYGKQFSHAERLHVYINELLNENNITTHQLNAIAVSMGPGSYTGLRIGVSAAKGLCFALNIPLIAISTLESLAHQVKTDSGLIVPMLDARRLEVYTAKYTANYELLDQTTAKVLDESTFQDELNSDEVYFIGSGVKKTKELITHTNAVFIDEKLPSANEMGALAYAKYKISDIEDVAYFEPFYLKDFIAIPSKK